MGGVGVVSVGGVSSILGFPGSIYSSWNYLLVWIKPYVSLGWGGTGKE